MNHRTGQSAPAKARASVAREPILSPLTRAMISGAGVLLLFYFARSVVLPIVLAWVGSMALKPPVLWLRRHHFPVPVAAGLVMLLLTAGLTSGLVHFGSPVADWVKSAPETLPRLRQKYQRVLRPISRLTEAVYGVEAESKGASQAGPAAALPAGGGGQIAGTLFSWTGSVLAGVVETAVLMFLLLVSGDRYAEKLARAAPTMNGPKDAAEIFRQIQQHISSYLFAVSLINITLGCAVGFTLSLTGMPNAAMWGAVAAVANFIPYFGPVVGVAAVACAGLLAFDNVGRALLPAGGYLAWHLLEADMFTPFLLGRRFKLNAFVIFVMLMFCGWLWGVLGALLAMPLLVSINVVCGRVPALAPLEKFLSA